VKRRIIGAIHKKRRPFKRRPMLTDAPSKMSSDRQVDVTAK